MDKETLDKIKVNWRTFKRYYNENKSNFNVVYGALAAFMMMFIVVQLFDDLTIKRRAMIVLSNNPLVEYKGDSIIIEEITIVPEEIDSLRVILKRADMIDKFVERNDLYGYDRVIGSISGNHEPIYFRYTNDVISSRIRVSQKGEYGYEALGILMNFDSDFEYYLTKYKKYYKRLLIKEKRKEKKLKILLEKANNL